jgi:catechol 2,3-dioxygenase-like lactoylglutathione lyase family enzyme
MSMTQTKAPSSDEVDHFAFTVRDVDKSAEWYKRIFRVDVVQGTRSHYGRERAGCLELVIEPRTGLAIGLHHNSANRGEPMDEARTGTDHISLKVDGRQGLDAWARGLDSEGHAGVR